jgi:hypothetical protein
MKLPGNNTTGYEDDIEAWGSEGKSLKPPDKSIKTLLYFSMMTWVSNYFKLYFAWSAAVRLLELRVRIPPGAWMSVSFELLWRNVRISLTGRSLVQESYRDRGREERECVSVSLRVITLHLHWASKVTLRKRKNFAWWRQFRRMPPKPHDVNNINTLLYPTKTRSKVIFKPRCQHYAKINADELILRKWIVTPLCYLVTVLVPQRPFFAHKYLI